MKNLPKEFMSQALKTDGMSQHKGKYLVQWVDKKAYLIFIDQEGQAYTILSGNNIGDIQRELNRAGYRQISDAPPENFSKPEKACKWNFRNTEARIVGFLAGGMLIMVPLM